MKPVQLVLLGLLLLFPLGCDGSTGPVELVVSTLECQVADDLYISCELTLDERSMLEIEFLDRKCGARGNTVRMLKPVEETLMTDGCYSPPLGSVWTFPGPFDPGTEVAMEFISPRLEFDPGMRVEGDYPLWTLFFEDGGDQDFYDIVLELRAVVLD
jgi:hypothetical protein